MNDADSLIILELVSEKSTHLPWLCSQELAQPSTQDPNFPLKVMSRIIFQRIRLAVRPVLREQILASLLRSRALFKIETLAVILAVSAANDIEDVVGADVHDKAVAEVLAFAARVESFGADAFTLAGGDFAVDQGSEDLRVEEWSAEEGRWRGRARGSGKRTTPAPLPYLQSP